MKKFLIVLFALIIGGAGGYFAYRYFNKGGSESNENSSKTLADYTDTDFQWGVTMRASALGNYQPEIWTKQIKLAKKLGVGWARISWDYENKDPFGRNDSVINYLIDNGIQVVLIIEQDPKKTNIDNYQDGYDEGFKIASHYKGKIRFYQMANEGGAQTIKEPTMNGQDESQYDNQKYVPLRDFVRGLSEGIYKADPDAWRIVSTAFTHTGYLDKLIKDKVPFDMIGIDWYDWMGPFGEKKLDSGQLLYDKMKSYNRPLTFMEVNAVPSKKKVDEEAQAETISSTAKWAWQNKDYVKGFYVLELIDNINNKSENAEYFGIVSAKKANVIGEPRQAYTTYQELIKKYSGQ